MIRFANPGSNLDNMAEIFVALFHDLSALPSFGLDHMSKSMVSHNLAASCGRMGDEALARSNRADRSRDPLYNQSKMYSEVYRSLGWITSTPDSRLTFQFTLLGAHVAGAERSIKLLMQECFLGIAYPNPTLDIKFECSIRPFATFLKTMADLGGCISRDELIYGPMNLHDDRDASEYEEMVKEIESCRKHRNLARKLEGRLAARGITHVSAGNYTRFPLAVLKWAGWAERVSKNVYGRSEPFLQITDAGRRVLQILQTRMDIRRSDVTNLESDIKRDVIAMGFYNMLKRCGFSTDPIAAQMQTWKQRLISNNIDPDAILFSPFQELAPLEISRDSDIVPIYTDKTRGVNNLGSCASTTGSSPVPVASSLFSVVLKGSPRRSATCELDIIWKQSGQRLDKAIELFVSEHAHDNKEVFYPLVARLFTLAGFPCEASRNGVNYQRADATITLGNGLLIPIEIKSPGEEMMVSVKAVRQAVENRIILLSRQADRSRSDLTSLVVGFNYPNDRAEVNELLNDVNVAYGFNIGIVDIRSLAEIAFANVYFGKSVSQTDLEHIHGFFAIHS